MAKLRTWGRWRSSKDAFKSGGQAELYEVIDTSGTDSGVFVLKQLRNPKRRARFDAEIHAIASLPPHENVVALLDSGTYRDADRPCYVMPKADGSLEDLIQEGSVDVETALTIFRGVLSGTAHIHAARIIHRDLKPENILMFANTPRIADLGLCLIVDLPRVTPTEEAVGPRQYMAPELEDGRVFEVTPAADVYSLGKVLYYLLSGGRVFSREKQNLRQWRLSDVFADKRYEIFTPIFGASIHHDHRSRMRDASEFLDSFEEASQQWLAHPVTSLGRKMLHEAGDIYESSRFLSELTGAEWKELFTLRAARKMSFSAKFFRAAEKALCSDFVEQFADMLIQNASEVGERIASKAAGKALILLPKEGYPAIDRYRILVNLAAPSASKRLLRAIAANLIGAPDAAYKLLAARYDELTPSERANFLAFSYRHPYEGKEQALLRISAAPDCDLLCIEGAIAGLARCGSPKAIDRVCELLQQEEPRDRMMAAIRGVTLGSNSETIAKLKRRRLGNEVVTRLLEMLSDKSMKKAVERD